MEKVKLDDLQLAVMQILWRMGQATVGQLRDELAPDRPLAHTTIGTILSRLEKRALVSHSTQGKHYVYRPLVSEEVARESMVSSLVNQLFRGNSANLAQYLIKHTDFDAQELEKLRQMIDQSPE